MEIYCFLVLYILLGQAFLSRKKISRKLYSISVCIFLVLITGLRNPSVGIWDTQTVYLPSFKVIQNNSIFDIIQMEDTHYKFIGFVLYSKFIGLISTSETFYIIMMAWPFYVCVTYLINKWANMPGYSFLVLLGFGYFTYSFSMIRGMLAFAFIALALNAAIEEKWEKFLVYVFLGASCHITALAFLLVYPIKKIEWNIKKIICIFCIMVSFNKILPVLWKYFVTTFIKNVLPTYNYYGSRGGELAVGMLILYLMVLVVALFKMWVSNNTKLAISSIKPIIKIKKKTIQVNKEKDLNNLLVGMTIAGCVLIYMTSVLSEMMRIAMFFGLGSVLLAGNRSPGYVRNPWNKNCIALIELIQGALIIIYFFIAALPNMNSVPYKFFFQ